MTVWHRKGTPSTCHPRLTGEPSLIGLRCLPVSKTVPEPPTNPLRRTVSGTMPRLPQHQRFNSNKLPSSSANMALRNGLGKFWIRDGLLCIYMQICCDEEMLSVHPSLSSNEILNMLTAIRQTKCAWVTAWPFAGGPLWLPCVEASQKSCCKLA
jgi:hypothetical protein